MQKTFYTSSISIKSMQVQIKFDTEKESLDDLKRLVNSLQELIAQREKTPTQAPQQVYQPQTYNVQQQPATPKPQGSHTAGGGRIMDYDPSVGDLLSKFASGNKY